MDIKLIIGISAGTLTAIASLPQIIKTLKTKKVDHVSPLMFLILMTGNGLWAWYGILLSDWPIIITNTFSFSLDVVMIILRLVYAKQRTSSG